MKQQLCAFIYYKLLGWKTKVTVPDCDKYIICAAPHTSNWDFLIGKFFYAAIGRETKFMMKKEWFFFPMGAWLRYMGGIPVYRSKKTSLVEQVVREIAKSKVFHLAITPEGTRSANPNWKKGFYYIASKANIPIVLIGIDYKTKTVTAEKMITPSGDMEADIREIQRYFTQFTGRNPQNFAVGAL